MHRNGSSAEADASHAGLRLDRFLSDCLPELSRTRVQALIRSGHASLRGATIEDPKHRVKPGDLYALTAPPDRSTRTARRSHPARRGPRGRRADRHRQAGRARRASRRGQRGRHAGQRADRSLRREPVGHRRRGTARHRAPPRQGHERAAGRGQDRPGAPRARRAVRRSRPQRRARAPSISRSSGALRLASRASSMRRSAAIRRAAPRWRCFRPARDAMR